MLAIIGANLAGLLIAIVLFLAMKRVGKIKKPWAKKFVPWLAFATGAVLTSTVVGVWAANIGAALGNWALIFGAAAFIVGIYIVADLIDGQMDSKWTGVGLVVLPLLCMGGFGLFPDAVASINEDAGGGIIATIGPWIGA